MKPLSTFLSGMLLLTLLISCTGNRTITPTVADDAIPAMPLKAPYEHTLEFAWAQKEVFASKLLSDAENMEPWTHAGEFGALTLSADKPYKGSKSLLITSPTKGPSAPPWGRPWGESGAFFTVAAEDWTAWNRITFWIYPDLPGFKEVSVNTIFYNDGEDKVPGIKNGVNFQQLKNRAWNKVYWEIEHLGREKVTGFVIQYRLQGNEPGAATNVKYYLDEVYLEKVVPDHYEGWDVQPGEAAYNHAGYAQGFPKTALLPETAGPDFYLVDADDQTKVYQGKTEHRELPLGNYPVADFSSFGSPGTYCIESGAFRSKPFRIGSFHSVFRSSIIKTINHFYTQRCGHLVEGVHDACHLDWLCLHGDRSVNIHGGWHDAGDVSQGLGNTSEATLGMAQLAMKLKEKDAVLAERLLEEARWGTAWLMKTRFGDGFRATWSVKDMWTDDIIGNEDDYQSQASDDAQSNFMGATAEAAVAMAFAEKDTLFADYALQCAREDFDFATARVQQRLRADLAGQGLVAALTLFEATEEAKYKEAAFRYADYIVSCQQQGVLAGGVDLKGFFYTTPAKETILHYPHRGHEHTIATGLARICRLFPDDAAHWLKAAELYAAYYKATTAYTAPYNMIAAGIYDLSTAENEEEETQIRGGIRLSDRYYIKRFPVWGEFRGNSGLILTQAKGLAEIASLLDDRELLTIAYHQLEWNLGKNPFAQSLMYGEGYRYAGQYSVMSGNLVGGLPVGVQTHFDRDTPYWPAENCHNWKEIWVHPSALWLMLMADFLY